jgi:nucleoside-diphosphate-sugar epimerase
MISSKKTNIIVTGGSGFIGGYLKRYLEQSYKIFAPRHDELELTDAQAVVDYIAVNQIAAVVHCAHQKPGKSSESYEMVERNLRIFFNLAANLDHLEKFIVLGSGAEYGKFRPLVKVGEEEFGKYVPKDDYGFYKYAISQYIERAENLICLRLFGIYGPGENYLFSFISNSIVKNLLKQDLKVNRNAKFSYLYVTDLGPVVEYFLTHKAHYKSYNVVPDQTVELVGICQMINGISEFQSKVSTLNQGNSYEYTGSNARLRQELPGVQFTGIRDGIKSLFDYYKGLASQLDREAIINDEYLVQVRAQTRPKN